MGDENVFAAGKARQKKAFIVGAGFVGILAICSAGWAWYFSTSRLVDANAGMFFRLRKEYCAVVSAVASDPSVGTREAPSKAVRVPSLVSMYADDGGGYLGKGANAEVVELSELEWLCSVTLPQTGSIEKAALGKRIHGDAFESSLSDVFDRERLPYLRYKGVEAVLPFFSDLRYIAVIESKRTKEGAGTVAMVSLFRLEDAKRLSRVEVELSGPAGGVAWVKKGENVQDALLDASRHQTHRNHQAAIAAAFKKEAFDFAFNGLN